MVRPQRLRSQQEKLKSEKGRRRYHVASKGKWSRRLRHVQERNASDTVEQIVFNIPMSQAMEKSGDTWIVCCSCMPQDLVRRDATRKTSRECTKTTIDQQSPGEQKGKCPSDQCRGGRLEANSGAVRRRSEAAMQETEVEEGTGDKHVHSGQGFFSPISGKTKKTFAGGNVDLHLCRSSVRKLVE